LGKGDDTRRVIIDYALKQAIFLGFENLSIGHLADQLGMSKSGVFAHFKSKEFLQLAVLEEAIQRFTVSVVAPALRQPDPKARLEALFELHLKWINGNGDTPGCLFMMLLSEFRERPGEVRNSLLKAQDDWYRVVQRLAKEAFGSKVDTQQFAFEMLSLQVGYQHWSNLIGRQKGLSRAKQAFANQLQHYGGSN